MTAEEMIRQLRSQANPRNVEGMARYGINPHNTLGISIPALRKLARQAGHDHELAEELWASGIHEGRILACFVDEPASVTPGQMDRWARDFDSWDICDQCCANLFDRTPYAYKKAMQWSNRRQEFVRRAGFALMAALAVHDKDAADDEFRHFFPRIIDAATDDRNFVKKSVNWALRQIGKRSLALNREAIDLAKQIEKVDSKAARWIARDALRELTSEKVASKLK